MTVHPDGALKPALTKLEYAVNALICPLSDGHGHTAASTYQQLCEASEGRSRASNHHVARSIPPVNLDAISLRLAIDDRIATEQSTPAKGTTPDRLVRIANRKFRPQDVHWLEQFTAVLQSWTADIRELLDPTPKITIAAPCPVCDVSIVYRKDPAGDLVRKAALQIDYSQGCCVCQNCRTSWPHERLDLLRKVLET